MERTILTSTSSPPQQTFYISNAEFMDDYVLEWLFDDEELGIFTPTQPTQPTQPTHQDKKVKMTKMAPARSVTAVNASSALPSIALTDGLYRSDEERNLLNVIDTLRTQKLGQLISIPQVIIVGDQSSGKSSTLEAGTGIPFPTADGLCTVFATELRLRRDQELKISIHIVPAPHRTEQEKKEIEKFGLECNTLTREDIGGWINKAKEAMGISEANPISEDVLQISVSGPDYPLLTIVDLPGLVHAGRGKESIQSMVNNYMAEPRSVILAVVSGKNDIENQKVLDLVKMYDPDGLRTLGIITKPDIPKEGTKSEKDLVALAKNQHEQFRFTLGWHVLRNRGEKEAGCSEEKRDEAERKFFSTGPWKEVPRPFVGKDALKARLSDVLLTQIRAEFPALMAEVKGKFVEHKRMLDKLGDSRASLDEQRSFLVGVGNKFQHLVNDAISGSYGRRFFGESQSEHGYQKRLRAVVQNLNVEFAEDMRLRGHTRQIVETINPLAPAIAFDKTVPSKISRKDYCKEVAENLKRSRGSELPGMFNPLMVRDLFVNQVTPWKGLATRHIQASIAAVKYFLDAAVADLTRIAVQDPIMQGNMARNDMEAAIQRELVAPFIADRSEDMMQKLENLLQSYRVRNPITYNHYFTENVQNLRKKRLQDRIQVQLCKHFGWPEGEFESYAKGGLGQIDLIKFVAGVSSENDADMDKFACTEIVDYMEAYFKVAQKMFVDNVAIQIVEEQLIEHLPDLLSPPSIQKMSPHLISKISAESTGDQVRRQELKRVLAILGQSLETCSMFSAGASMTPKKRKWTDDL